MSILNALTIDVEDYYQVSAFEKEIDRKNWHDHESRVEANTQRILELLDDHAIKATFFVLGWVARQHPRLVRAIHQEGHEIGSHSYWHHLVYQQTPEQFRSDLRHSRRVIEDVIGESICSYRAPSFSITKDSRWVLQILVEEGIKIDSSIFPIRHDRYGVPNAEPRIHQIETPAGMLWEFPPTVFRAIGLNIPVGGGGYFRLYPFTLTRLLLNRVSERSGQPFIFYFHPWEIDPDQPRLPVTSRVSRLRHYINLSSTERKLNWLFERFRFGRVCDIVRQFASSTPNDAIETTKMQVNANRG